MSDSSIIDPKIFEYLAKSEKDRAAKHSPAFGEDPRKTGLKNGLRQLTVEQIQRVIDYPGEMVLDSYNYEDGKFCALAIGVGLDKTMNNPSHEKVYETLTGMGYKVYNTRGIPGEFYTNNRLEDLLEAAKEVLQEKIKENANQ